VLVGVDGSWKPAMRAARAPSALMISWITKCNRVVLPSTHLTFTSFNRVSNLKALTSPPNVPAVSQFPVFKITSRSFVKVRLPFRSLQAIFTIQHNTEQISLPVTTNISLQYKVTNS
jgi:hypothetical protein